MLKMAIRFVAAAGPLWIAFSGNAFAWNVSCEGGDCWAVHKYQEGKYLAIKQVIGGRCSVILSHPGWRLKYPDKENVFILIDGKIHEEDWAKKFREDWQRAKGKEKPVGLTVASGLQDTVLLGLGCDSFSAFKDGKEMIVRTKFADYTYDLKGSAAAIRQLEAEVARRAERAKDWPLKE